MGVLLKKKKSIFTITVLSSLLAFAVTGIFIVAFVFGFGIRSCPYGSYADGPFCIKCSDVLGKQCTGCSGPFKCTDCDFGLYPD